MSEEVCVCVLSEKVCLYTQIGLQLSMNMNYRQR